MNFKEASDKLFDCVNHETLAKSLGVSVASVRQARLKENAQAHREAPKEWQNAVIRLAEERVGHFRRLIEELRKQKGEN